MLILGIESSCDETGVALYDTDKGLIADALHTQIEMHRLYGGVVPELASRDHIRRIIPLLNEVMKKPVRHRRIWMPLLLRKVRDLPGHSSSEIPWLTVSGLR